MPGSARSDWVADELRRAILNRTVLPGERLAAVALAQRLNVSQTPLREAFARLAGEGWVDYEPQRGVRVAEISIQEMVEIYELRELLEPMAVRRSALAGGEEWRESVQAAFDDMVALQGADPAALAGPDYDAYDEAHRRFHRAVVSECGSQWMIRLTTMLSDHSSRYRRLSLPLRGNSSAVHSEHKRILLSAGKGKADKAAEAALEHVHKTKDAILAWLSESDLDPGASADAIEAEAAAIRPSRRRSPAGNRSLA